MRCEIITRGLIGEADRLQVEFATGSASANLHLSVKKKKIFKLDLSCKSFPGIIRLPARVSIKLWLWTLFFPPTGEICMFPLSKVLKNKLTCLTRPRDVSPEAKLFRQSLDFFSVAIAIRCKLSTVITAVPEKINENHFFFCQDTHVKDFSH